MLEMWVQIPQTHQFGRYRRLGNSRPEVLPVASCWGAGRQACRLAYPNPAPHKPQPKGSMKSKSPVVVHVTPPDMSRSEAQRLLAHDPRLKRTLAKLADAEDLPEETKRTVAIWHLERAREREQATSTYPQIL